MNAASPAATFESAVAQLRQDLAAPPPMPENWYLLATSAELRPGGIISRNISGHNIILARMASGRVAAFDAHCAHMGCHLKHGAVVGEHLRCALHFRKIAADGCFLRPDGTPSSDLVQPTYRTAERYGAVFVYIGGAEPPGLPEPSILDPSEMIARPAGQFTTPTPWYALIANGFDMEHLLAVHARELKEPADVTMPDEHSFRIGYRTRVTGRSLSDRLMKWMSGDDIRASMTAINGTTMLVQSQAGPRPTIFMLSLCPTAEGGTLVRAIVGLRGKAGNLADRLKLRLAGWLFIRFLSRDFGIFEGLEWHPPKFAHSSGDRHTKQMFDYLCRLKPAAEIGMRGTRSERQP